MSLRSRPYESGAHRAACLALFDGNVAGPHRPDGTFRAEERIEFEGFLDDPPGPYRVLEEDGTVAACGGWAPEEEPGLVSLCWTVVAPGRQGRGLGRRLVETLMEEARTDPGTRATRVRLDTVPDTRGFFEELGFGVVAVEPGGYGPGMPPRVEMVREL